MENELKNVRTENKSFSVHIKTMKLTIKIHTLMCPPAHSTDMNLREQLVTNYSLAVNHFKRDSFINLFSPL